MTADDARIKDTISNLRKVEKHLYGTNTRVALLLKHGLDELEVLLAAPPLGEAPTRQTSEDLWCFVDDIRAQVEAKGRLDWVDGKNLLRVVDALKFELDATQPPRVASSETIMVSCDVLSTPHIKDELEPCINPVELSTYEFLKAQKDELMEKERTRTIESYEASSELRSTVESLRNEIENLKTLQADREHQIRANALEEAARIVESEFFNEVDTFFRGGKIPTVSEWNDEAIKVSEHIRALIPQAAQGFAKRREAEIRCELLESLANSSKCPHCEESLRERAEVSRRALAGSAPGEERADV